MTALLDTTALAQATPVEIDTVLFALYQDQHREGTRVNLAADRVHRAAGDKRQYGRGGGDWALTLREAERKATEVANDAEAPVWDREPAEIAVRALADARTDLEAIHAEMRRIGAEFIRRGGWTRAFLVNNANGHVHKSMTCSTCFVDTDFHWVVEFSGSTEDQVVAAAGYRACTVCYPNAPVTSFASTRAAEKALPTSIFSDLEREQQKARAERAEAKAKRDAAKIAKGLTADGSEFQVSWPAPGNKYVFDRETRQGSYVFDADKVETERFKTEQTATQWVVSDLADQINGWGFERSTQRAVAHDAIIEAVAAKHGKTVVQVREEFAAKAAAKAKRDAR